jgi:hypothetical protein
MQSENSKNTERNDFLEFNTEPLSSLLIQKTPATSLPSMQTERKTFKVQPASNSKFTSCDQK